MTSKHTEERRQKEDEASKRGFKDGYEDDIDSRSAYDDKPNERKAYVDSYLDGFNTRKHHERVAILEQLAKEADQKHEEKIDRFLSKLVSLIANPEKEFGPFSRQYDEVKRMLLELIPRHG